MSKYLYKTVVLLFLLGMLFLLSVYGMSEYQLRQVELPPLFSYTIKTDENTIQRGKHLLKTRGCFGCHGQQLEGRVKTDWEWVKQAVPPNLVLFAKQYNPAIIERAIRHGIDHNEKAMWTMPSYNFKHLSDDDIGAIIAYLLQAPLVEKALEEPIMGLKARWQLLTGQAEHMVQWVDKVPELKIDKRVNPDLARGEYIAMTSCNECHGFDLKGEASVVFPTPDLTLMIKVFNEADFRRLMSQGIGLGGREELGLMSMVAKDRFAYFTEQELVDLYRYLNAMSHAVNVEPL